MPSKDLGVANQAVQPLCKNHVLFERLSLAHTMGWVILHSRCACKEY